jgi:hypothetical protein
MFSEDPYCYVSMFFVLLLFSPLGEITKRFLRNDHKIVLLKKGYSLCLFR